MTLLAILAVLVGVIATGAGCLYLISERIGNVFDFDDDE